MRRASNGSLDRTDVNETDGNGWTALEGAAGRGYESVVARLLAADAGEIDLLSRKLERAVAFLGTVAMSLGGKELPLDGI